MHAPSLSHGELKNRMHTAANRRWRYKKTQTTVTNNNQHMQTKLWDLSIIEPGNETGLFYSCQSLHWVRDKSWFSHVRWAVSYRRVPMCREVETWVSDSTRDRRAVALTTGASAANVCWCTHCSILCHTYDNGANTRTFTHTYPFNRYLTDFTGSATALLEIWRPTIYCDWQPYIEFANLGQKMDINKFSN